jgi:hypothetical protein
MQGKQAKIVSPTQERAILGYLATTRYPTQDGSVTNYCADTSPSRQ